ncbi:hypothetical protein R1flu_018936 [Riccia fluitans]|uniref:Uncharacterized protein n=1 Tax=Riccia fluitans TaxID=41844 RepID=A0ABD1ZHE9_9MARC
MDKFFGLQDPTTSDDAQASPDFEEDLRTNERVRLRAEVRNLGAEPQQLTRSTRVRLEYEPTILPDVAPTENPASPVTLDLTVDAREDPSSLPQSQIVPIPTFVDLTQYISSPENEGSEDQGWPRKEDLTKVDLDSSMYKGCYLRGNVINMYINQSFLKKPREQLHNMLYVNTFWFTKARELVARYDKTNHDEEPMVNITRLRKSICPEFHEEDMQGSFQRGSSCLFMAKTIGHLPSSDFITMLLCWLTWIVSEGPMIERQYSTSSRPYYVSSCPLIRL